MRIFKSTPVKVVINMIAIKAFFKKWSFPKKENNNV